jgi:hypothetical protein
MATWEIHKADDDRESLADIVVVMAKPHARLLGWSDAAIDAYVREKMRGFPKFAPVDVATSTPQGRAAAQVKWCHEHVVCALINEVI